MAELRSSLAQSSAVHRTNWRRRSMTGGKLVVSLGTFAAAGYVLWTVSGLAFGARCEKTEIAYYIAHTPLSPSLLLTFLFLNCY